MDASRKSKRRADGDSSDTPEKRGPGAPASDKDEGAEDLQFEDPFEDEFESEPEEEDDEGMDEDDGEDDEGAGSSSRQRVFRPGVDKLGEGEVLDFDSSAYRTLHRLNLEWPCMSFDFLKDELGFKRTKFPMTQYMVMGTQAAKADQNQIVFIKMSEMCRTEHDDASDSDNESDDETEDDPVVESRIIRHKGCINRIRSMPQQPHIVATWSENSNVYVFNGERHIRALDEPPAEKVTAKVQPLFTHTRHSTEGFAMAWSPVTAGRMATGDCASGLFVWDPAQGGSWEVNEEGYTGHTDSVEDIQWSPTEANVFASGSVDCTVRIWDTRNRGGSALHIRAHEQDVNVISWNSNVSHLLVSGSDDGSFKIWDLRNFKESTPAAHFKWHNAPITSVAWCPWEGSMLAVSSDDHQVSIWDLAVEADDEAPAEDDLAHFPAQLLFLHQGQKNVKEVHWHAQIQYMLGSTSYDGFNAFIPSNLFETA